MSSRGPLTPDQDYRRRRLARYLERHDVNCAQVAQLLGVAHQTVRLWKAGVRAMPKRRLRELLGAGEVGA